MIARKTLGLPREILKLDPRNAAAMQVRGCALLMQKRAADALAPLQAAAQSLRDAETTRFSPWRCGKPDGPRRHYRGSSESHDAVG